MSKRRYSQAPTLPKYRNLSYGYCYLHKKFGHKALNFQAYVGRNQRRNQRRNESNNKLINANRNTIKNSNPFAPLFDVIECVYCHNYGHKEYECKLINFIPLAQAKQMKK